MEPAAVKRLSPADRGKRAILSFERKVSLLERWGRLGVPDGAAVPRDRAKLRRWPDVSERLWPWVDPALDHPRGRNAHLHTRFLLAIEAIDAAARTRSQGRSSPGGGHADAALAKVNQELVLQNARLLDELIQLRKAQAPRRARQSR